MSELLIDDSGEVWPVEPETIAHRFSGLRTRRDVVCQAIALGFIFVRFYETAARVALRPQLASRLAISRLFDIIGQRNPARVALARDARLSSWELVFGADRAIARIEQALAEARSPVPRPLLTAQRLPLERCPDIAGAQLLPILQAWQQRQGRWEADFYGRLLEWKLLPVTIISEQPRASTRLLIRHWGIHIATFGKDWTRIAQGRDIEDQPNTDIGRLNGARHRQTLAAGAPEFTASDLVLRRIDGTLARVTFYRLGLPWRTSDGAAMVTAITARRRTIVLERLNPAN